MSINRWTDKEDVKHIYNEILFSHEKERNWVISSDVDGPRVCQTELNKSKREKQTLYINSYAWNIERWYRWACLQARNRDTKRTNMWTQVGRERRWDEQGEYDWDIYTAAAAAKSLQSCPTLCDPIDVSPWGSPVPGILQARTLEWVAISFSNSGKWKVRVKSPSRVQLFATPWTAAYQAPPSMGFSRWEYWSGVPLPHYHV